MSQFQSFSSREKLIEAIDNWFFTKREYIEELYLKVQETHLENIKKQLKEISLKKQEKYKEFTLNLNNDPKYTMSTVVKSDPTKTVKELAQIKKDTIQEIKDMLLTHKTKCNHVYKYVQHIVAICYDLIYFKFVTTEGETINISYLDEKLQNNQNLRDLLDEISTITYEHDLLNVTQMDTKNINTNNIEEFPKRSDCKKMYGDITKWNVSQVTSFKNCFTGKNAIVLFDYPLEWDLSSANDVSFMFEGCYNLQSPLKLTTSSKITTARNMFYGCNKFNHPLELTFYKDADITGIFDCCCSLKSPIKINMIEFEKEPDVPYVDKYDYYVRSKNSNIIPITEKIYNIVKDLTEKELVEYLNKTEEEKKKDWYDENGNEILPKYEIRHNKTIINIQHVIDQYINMNNK